MKVKMYWDSKIDKTGSPTRSTDVSRVLVEYMDSADDYPETYIEVFP